MAKKFKFPKPMPPAIPQLHRHLFDLGQEDYHAIRGTYSSSQFKDLLDDEEIFIKKYIHKTIEREDVPAFSVGNYFHTGVLEPHKLKDDCVVYDGKVRRGAHWEKFKEANSKKTIITPVQKAQAEMLVGLVQDSPVSMGFIQRGRPEVSLFIKLVVEYDYIYAPKFGVVLDGKRGWVSHWSPFPPSSDAKEIIVKVRADSWGPDFILDLKSTTGNARSEFAMRGKISYYQYDLSAALYLDMFQLLDGNHRDFIWTFASKDCQNCKSYKASPLNIEIGRAKYMKAIRKLASCMRHDFQVYDELGTLHPMHYELEHIKETDNDFL